MTDSFGDVTGEYQALHESSGLVADAHELVIVSGPDAGGFLDSLLSQDLTGMSSGDVVRSLLLGPRGKLRAPLWVGLLDDAFHLVTDIGAGTQVQEDLLRFRLRVDVEVADPQPMLDLIGPGSATVLAGAGLAVPTGVAGWDDGVAIRAPLGHLDRFYVPHPGREALLAAGARMVGDLAATAVRVEMGEPRMGRDIDDSTIPQETPLVEETISFEKGCFLGQELVARIDSRGHVNRHLRGIVISENSLPPEKAEIWSDSDMVGELTSVSESLRVGAPIGLGLVRREVLPGDSVEIRWAGGKVGAEVRDLPLLQKHMVA
ncbi:MAG: glycine cleavage T C-terminal barrel domain-containing protein [Acidimicrobiia bacterium]